MLKALKNNRDEMIIKPKLLVESDDTLVDFLIKKIKKLNKKALKLSKTGDYKPALDVNIEKFALSQILFYNFESESEGYFKAWLAMA